MNFFIKSKNYHFEQFCREGSSSRSDVIKSYYVIFDLSPVLFSIICDHLNEEGGEITKYVHSSELSAHNFDESVEILDGNIKLLVRPTAKEKKYMDGSSENPFDFDQDRIINGKSWIEFHYYLSDDDFKIFLSYLNNSNPSHVKFSFFEGEKSPEFLKFDLQKWDFDFLAIKDFMFCFE